MKKSILVIILLAVVLGLGGWFLFAGRSDDKPGTAPQPTSENQQATNQSTSAPSQDATPNNTQNSQTATDTVEIKGMAFQPATSTVRKGTTVTWINRDTVQHDVTPDKESDVFRGSELLARDESHSFTFNTPGTYTYHCSPHPQMTGTVTVTE